MEPVRGWCFTLSSSFCVTFLSLFQTHILNIHVYLKATSISSPFLSHFLLLHLLSALTCLRVSLLLPPPLLIQMKMYLGCMTDSSMVSAFSTLFNFKSTTHNLLAGIYVKDVTASQDQWYRMLQWKLKILFFFSCCLQHAAFSEYWFFDVGHMLHLMHLTCGRQGGEHVSVLGGEVGVASGWTRLFFQFCLSM